MKNQMNQNKRNLDYLYKIDSEIKLKTNEKHHRSSHRRCSVKNVFIEISQNSQENNCARVSFFGATMENGQLLIYHKARVNKLNPYSS